MLKVNVIKGQTHQKFQKYNSKLIKDNVKKSKQLTQLNICREK